MLRDSIQDIDSAAELNIDWEAMERVSLPYMDLASIYYEVGMCHTSENSSDKRFGQNRQYSEEDEKIGPRLLQELQKDSLVKPENVTEVRQVRHFMRECWKLFSVTF